MRQGYQKSIQQQSTCFVTVWCQYHWVQLQTVAKTTSSPGPSCGQTWLNVVHQVPLIICARLVWWLFNERGNHSTSHLSGYWSTALRRILHIPIHKHNFSHTERVALHRHGFSNRCWNGVITWFVIWPMLSLGIQTLDTKLSSMD